MKKYILIFLTTSLVLSGCQSQLEDQFYDPDKYELPESEVPAGMFAKMISEGKIFTQDYGEWWWLMGGSGIPGYTQVATRTMSQNYDGIWDNWHMLNGDGFSDDNNIRTYFYDMNTRTRAWGLMKDLIGKGDAAWNQENALYYDLMTLIREFAMIRNTDFFNSIPYSDAGLGLEGIFFAKYDDPVVTASSALGALKTVAEKLDADYNGMSAGGKSLFAKQDVIFGGDINKWKQWTNAIRLKYALRVSAVNEALAKEHIQDVLSKNNLPSADFTRYLGYDVLEHTLVSGGETWTRGLYERFTSIFIPNVIMKRMNYGNDKYEEGVDDPRLPAIATPTRYGEYVGVRMDREYEANNPKYLEVINLKESDRPAGLTDDQWTLKKLYILNNSNYKKHLDVYLNVNHISCYNLQTYVFGEFPVVIQTKAETDLILAEIALKGLGNTGKTADAHLLDALSSSTNFWYTVNSLSKYDPTPTYFPNTDLSVLKPSKPTQGTIDTYGTFLKNQYTSASDKLEIIMQQKYIHLNLMGSYELWTELRRTRRPKLEPVTTRLQTKTKPQVERAKYPGNESSVNMENYLKVQSQDNFTSPIFWVKDANESYYRDSYID